MAGKLTQRQEKFCIAYIETGNASEAYRRSYTTENSKPETVHRRAKDMMSNSKILARIEELKGKIETSTIATAQQRQEFWTRVMLGREPDADMKERLKASELLGKAQGDFIERKRLEGEGLTVRVVYDD